MSLPFDATMKQLLAGRADDFVGVFGLPASDPAQVLNVDLSTVTAATDVAFGFGRPIREIVDLNFQSGPDPTLPARILLYNAALQVRFQVPTRSLVVLLRPKAAAKGFTGRLRTHSSGTRIDFRCEIVRMWRLPVDSFLTGGVGLLPLAPLCKMPSGRNAFDALRDVVRRIDQRVADEVERGEAVRLMTAAFILTGMRVKRHQLTDLFRGVRVMHETTAFDSYLEEGALRFAHRTLLRIGRMRFGVPGAETEDAILAIEDVDRLERMIEAVITAQSWADLLSTQ